MHGKYVFNRLDINVHSWNLNCEIFHNIIYIADKSNVPESLLPSQFFSVWFGIPYGHKEVKMCPIIFFLILLLNFDL